MTERRFVRVRIARPGLGIVEETYDRLSVEDVTCWRLNTMPPGMQLGIEQFGDDIGDRPAMQAALAFVANFAREDVKMMRRAA